MSTTNIDEHSKNSLDNISITLNHINDFYRKFCDKENNNDNFIHKIIEHTDNALDDIRRLKNKLHDVKITALEKSDYENRVFGDIDRVDLIYKKLRFFKCSINELVDQINKMDNEISLTYKELDDIERHTDSIIVAIKAFRQLS